MVFPKIQKAKSLIVYPLKLVLVPIVLICMFVVIDLGNEREVDVAKDMLKFLLKP